MGVDGWRAPKDCRGFFLSFPIAGAHFDVADGNWHIDAPYDTPVEPLLGVRVFSLLDDVAPRCGGTQIVAGSHRVIASWGAAHPQAVTKNARARRALWRSHTWFGELTRSDDPQARTGALMDRGGQIDGVPVRVVEVTGRAGDLVLMHPGVLHSRP